MVSIWWFIGLPVFILAIILMGGILTFIDYVFLEREQITKRGVIKAINGITDNDTGFASNGSVDQTTLLFEDGEVMTFGTIIPFVKLNKRCILKYEVTKLFGKIIFRAIEYDDANCVESAQEEKK